MPPASNARRAPRATRRSSGQVRSLILDAARETFLRRGFQGVTTREIADRAGVGESVLFRHFGSKFALFTTVALEPFRTFMADWAETWTGETEEAADVRDVMRSFVKGLYVFAHAHREVLVGLLMAEVAEGAPSSDLATAVKEPFTAALDFMSDRLGSYVAGRHSCGIQSRIAAAMSAILGRALFEDWLLMGDCPSIDLERWIDEVTDLLLDVQLPASGFLRR